MNGDATAIGALECGGADVDAADTDGMRPLHLAALNDKSAAASALEEGGAAVEAATRDGSRPLHCAVRYGYFEVTEALVMVGAEVAGVRADRDSRSRAREMLEMAGAESD